MTGRAAQKSQFSKEVPTRDRPPRKSREEMQTTSDATEPLGPSAQDEVPSS